MKTKAEKEISKEIQGIEITDELIATNKQYIAMNELYDKYDEMMDAIRKANNLKSYQDNADIKAIQGMQRRLLDKMSKVFQKVQHDQLFVKMFKCAMFSKAVKEVA